MKNKENVLPASYSNGFINESQCLLTQRLSVGARRQLLKRGLMLCAMVMFTGCDLYTEPDVEKAFRRISKVKKHLQRRLFGGEIIAQGYTLTDITKPFPFNTFIYSDLEKQMILRASRFRCVRNFRF